VSVLQRAVTVALWLACLGWTAASLKHDSLIMLVVGLSCGLAALRYQAACHRIDRMIQEATDHDPR
jgi:hypothetical protein